MNFAILTLTYGPSHARLSALLQSLEMFVPEGMISSIGVADLGTKDETQRVETFELLNRCPIPSFYLSCKRESWGALEKLMWELLGQEIDAVVFIQDDCLVSKQWLQTIQHAFDYNPDVVAIKPQVVYASDLIRNGIVGTKETFYLDFTNEGIIRRESLHVTNKSDSLCVQYITGFGGPCIAMRWNTLLHGGFDGVASRGLCISIPSPPVYCSQQGEELPQNTWGTPLNEINHIPSSVISEPINTTYQRLSDVNLGEIHHDEPWQQERMQWIARNCEGSVLDVGCADGGLYSFLNKTKVNRYVGVDLDKIRIEGAKKRYKQPFYVLDASCGLPWNYGAFGTIVLAECLEHMPFSRALKTLSLCADIVSDRLIITLPTSERMHKNVDHVWFPDLESISHLLQQFIDPSWGISMTPHPDFALIRIDRK